MKTASNNLMRLMGFKLQGDFGPFTCYTSKRNQVIWFIKSPPLEPPTMEQIEQMNLFRFAGFSWKQMSDQERDSWNQATSRANLRISGYNLWTFWICTQDRPAIATVEFQSGILLPGL
jgi:hypothetical protein